MTLTRACLFVSLAPFPQVAAAKLACMIRGKSKEQINEMFDAPAQ
jgi:hypothetical protein